MVKVATGGPNATETLPMTIKVPYFNDPFEDCGKSFSILGYGDIVLPGLLISYCLAFDLAKKALRKTYFIICSSGYTIGFRYFQTNLIGLICTYIALLIMESGQPALLYLVPCTLLPVMITGCMKGDFQLLWTGKQPILNEEITLSDDLNIDSLSDADLISDITTSSSLEL